MKIRELISAIESLSLDPETEVVISTFNGCFDRFNLEICDHEHDDGGVIQGPDPHGWNNAPRPLPTPVLSLDVTDQEERKPITF